MSTTEEWHWEGNVVDALASHLKKDGWEITNLADTYIKQQGVDIEAVRNDTQLLIEVKGYPSKNYRDPRRAGEKKRTNPSNQAQHWYSHALLKAMRLQTSNPKASVAMAFPDFPRYRTLFEETKSGLEKLGVLIFMVNEEGVVWRWGNDK